MTASRRTSYAAAAAAALLVAAAAVASCAAGASAERSATDERARFARLCLTKYAPKELELPAAPDAQHAAFCAEAETRYGDLVAAAQEPQPSPEEQWKAIREADFRRALDEDFAEPPPMLASNGKRGDRKARRDGAGDQLALAEVGAAASLPGIPDARWRQGALPYCFDATLPAAAEVRFEWAVLHVESSTCVRFLPQDSCAAASTKGLGAYVKVGKKAGDESCYARAGRQGGAQDINIPSWCGQGSLAHEILHTLGFKHMHTRIDRDKYVKVHFDRIENDASSRYQYKKVKASDGYKDYGAFDFGSIMMYPEAGGFRKAGETRPIMVPVAPHKWNGKGQRMAMSASDKAAVNKMYSCPKGGGGHGGDRGGTSHARGTGTGVRDSTFKAFVAETLKGTSARTVTLAAGKGRKITTHSVSVRGEPVAYFRLHNDPGRKDKNRDQPNLWQWSTDYGKHWTNVPSMVQSGGTRDSYAPGVSAVRLIEGLARRDGRLPKATLGTKLTSLGVKSSSKSKSGVWTVTCAAANTCPGGSGRLTRKYKLVNGFWHWTAGTSSKDYTYTRVATTWKGKACACHNALNARLLRAPGGKGSPSGRMRRGVKCKKPPTLKGEHVFYVKGRGTCERTTTLTCSANGDCRPKSGTGCRGQCVCGFDGWNECMCVRPVDTNSEACEDLDESHM